MSNINWKNLLNLDDTQLHDLRLIGYSYLKQGHFDKALIYFEGIIALSKNDPYDLQTLGALYLETGNHLAALDYLERALHVAPDHGPTLLNRVKALFLLGYRRQALMQAKKLQNHSNSHIANQTQALILAYS